MSLCVPSPGGSGFFGVPCEKAVGDGVEAAETTLAGDDVIAGECGAGGIPAYEVSPALADCDCASVLLGMCGVDASSEAAASGDGAAGTCHERDARRSEFDSMDRECCTGAVDANADGARAPGGSDGSALADNERSKPDATSGDWLRELLPRAPMTAVLRRR